MINLMPKKRNWNVMKVNSTYRKNFSVALLNWERNRQEDKFSFTRFERSGLRVPKHGYPDSL
jgi:hypothetical protein